MAAVYQNNWLQPVLCQVKEYTYREPYVYKVDLKEKFRMKKKNLSNLMKLLLKGRITEETELDLNNINIDELKKWLMGNHIKPELNSMIIEN